jgi:cyclase
MMTADLTRHIRVYEPHPGIFAFYDGRIEGQQFSDQPNWVDAGALSVGIASYAIVRGDHALIYDTHVSVPHALAVRAAMEAKGVLRFTVVLSHWHLDHVAGTAAFADCQVIANAKTDAHLRANLAAINAGTSSGMPVIDPLILPTQVFSGKMALTIGDLEVHLIEANIHSDDGTVLWLPKDRILLAGDTVEDCATYVVQPEQFATHLVELDRLAALNPRHVLPNHGSPDRIAAGGYDASILPAMQRYVHFLMLLKDNPRLAETPLRDVIAEDLASGALIWYEAYADVHLDNVQASLELYDHNG